MENSMTHRPPRGTGWKRSLLGLFLCLSGGLAIHAEESKEVALPRGPQMVFETTVMDMGRVRAGVDVEYTFSFKNAGDRDLVIEDIKTGCTCTIAGYYDRVVKPGEEGRIEVLVDTDKMKKRVSRVMQVFTNLPDKPVRRLRIMGEVWQPFLLKPSAAVIPFAEANRPRKKRLTIVNLMDRKVKLLEAKVDSPQFKVQLISQLEGKRYELIVETVPPLREKRVQGTVVLTTDDPEIPRIEVKALAHVTQEIHVVPAQVRFPAEMRAPVERAVFVRHTKGEPFSILSVKCTDPRLTVKFAAEEGKGKRKGYRVSVTAPEGFQMTEKQTFVKIATNKKTAPQITFSVDQIATNLAAKTRKQFRPQAKPPRDPK